MIVKQVAKGSWFPGKAAQGFRHLGSKQESPKIKNMTDVVGGGTFIFVGAKIRLRTALL